MSSQISAAADMGLLSRAARRQRVASVTYVYRKSKRGSICISYTRMPQCS